MNGINVIFSNNNTSGMKSIMFFVICFSVFLTTHAQEDQPFPILEGETLDNKEVKIPTDTGDKFTLIGMAYSKKSESDLQTWFSPIYQKFIHKPKNPGIFHVVYDVNVYFVPMFTGVKKAAYGKVMKKMKSQTDPRLVPHVMFYKGELQKYKEALDFQAKDVPYFFVVDTSGKIVFATSGAFSDDKLDQIEEILEL